MNDEKKLQSIAVFVLRRFNQESDTNSAETQRDLAYLKQLLDERYLDLETER